MEPCLAKAKILFSVLEQYIFQQRGKLFAWKKSEKAERLMLLADHSTYCSHTKLHNNAAASNII
jgi:hypothetical protein